ncbi:MAG: phosphoribosyltransferase [Candidatus Thorarchaeota archaeon]|nr:phosphoribosyltransferase [Candidatus Thorarchaeota archaeon]
MIVLQWKYRDRTHAGKVLAEELLQLELNALPLVLAVPNGGVAVAVPIARALGAELNVVIVRKLQIPYNPEAGFGALTSLGTLMLNKPLVARLGLTEKEIDSVKRKTERQIEERRKIYEGLIGHTEPLGRAVILVDDGLASGYTMMAAIDSVRVFHPESVTVAVPTAHDSSARMVEAAVDGLVCPRIETGFVFAVANAYQNWYDVSDSEVIEVLHQAADAVT